MSNTTAIDNVIPRADIVKRAARVGAEIRNIELSGDLSDQTIRAINQVLLPTGGQNRNMMAITITVSYTKDGMPVRSFVANGLVSSYH